jgi:hypothetical protein
VPKPYWSASTVIVTVTLGVSGSIARGVTWTEASSTPIVPRMARAIASHSCAVAPGVIPFLAPSYAAFSIEFRIMFKWCNY